MYQYNIVQNHDIVQKSGIFWVLFNSSCEVLFCFLSSHLAILSWFGFLCLMFPLFSLVAFLFLRLQIHDDIFHPLRTFSDLVRRLVDTSFSKYTRIWRRIIKGNKKNKNTITVKYIPVDDNILAAEILYMGESHIY